VNDFTSLFILDHSPPIARAGKLQTRGLSAGSLVESYLHLYSKMSGGEIIPHALPLPQRWINGWMDG